MSSPLHQSVADAAAKVSSELGDTLDLATLREIPRPPTKKNVSDATLAFFVDGNRHRDDLVLLISNPDFPHMVANDLERSKAVHDAAGPEVASRIVRPVSEGRCEGRSYAAFTRLSPISSFKIARHIQKRELAPRVVRWLTLLASDTRRTWADTPSFADHFVEPLRGILSDDDMPSSVHRVCDRALEFVAKDGADMFTTVEHGDFWIGNVLFHRRAFSSLNPWLGDFSVIDWGGSRNDGYPGIDLIRFCSSIFRADSPQTDSLINFYAEQLEISRFEVSVYCFLSLGHLGQRLHQFPKDRYISLVRQVHSFLDAHRLTE